MLEPLQLNKKVGQSMTKTIYLQLIGDLEMVKWKGLLLQNQAGPKAMFGLWLCLHGRMMTANRLIKWGLPANPKCVLCINCDEDRDHLFAMCPYGIQV
ncbi:hypothetical protein MTR67_000900 [Solanum verrucosum]|uniref:Reverse transcriptase zinc-binding domain-containing protein n=1 Tax=Solanum verrucosum TaxID=315347 RepID=A0AAF0PQU0_SOLVR|nr:hypothetical protein MTR67_000900 [Solanum verrucosum]